MAKIGAIEAGGTKMVMAIGDEKSNISEREEIPTTEPKECIPKMVEWFRLRNIDALGIGAFGPTAVNPKDPRFGHILITPKTAWINCDLRGPFLRELNVPVGYDTDVNVACLGEAVFGAAKGLSNVIYVTIGTGIGAGVMIEGNLLHGMLHAEAGHIHVERVPGDDFKCNCPYHDCCLEGMAAGPAIEKRWGKKGYELAGNDKVWDIESSYIAQGVATYILCYSPQKIVLGGGVMKQEQMFPQVRQKTLKLLGGYLVTPELDDIDNYIVPAGCGGDQGILGSLELGRRELEK
jgi:fructokinase